MKYSTDIQIASADPERMENLYHQAQLSNEESEFRLDMQEAFSKTPDNLLLAAWQARFARLPVLKVKRSIHWGLAVLLGVITGLILWAISDPKLIFLNTIPYFVFVWAPVATLPALIFLAVTTKKNYLFSVIAGVGLALATLYVLLIAPTQGRVSSRDYLMLMMLMLPLLCWIGLGISLLRFGSSTSNRFAFLIKSIEVIITAGIYLIAGMAFGGITLGLFAALNITPPEIVIRLVAAGGFGLIPLMAVASIYDTHAEPEAQDFSQGLSKFIFTLMRLLLPLTVLVLVVYICVIPFNFSAPFQHRELLIVYNVMQFAIIGLLVGVTPIKVDDLSSSLQTWLRRGILAVAILALLISLYALSAVTYRTALDGLTLNRTTIIGWNLINIGILLALVITQLRKGISSWHVRLQQVFSRATTAYLVWTVLLIALLPLIFK